MIATTDIETEVRGFLISSFLFGREDQLGDGENLLDRVIDSTGVLELVTFIQERFSIFVEDEEVNPDNLGSVKNIVAFVSKKLASGS